MAKVKAAKQKKLPEEKSKEAQIRERLGRKLPNLIGKKLPSGETVQLKDIIKTKYVGQNGIESLVSFRYIARELRKLIKVYPGGPSFLGEEVKYPKSHGFWFFRKRKSHDLNEIRAHVNKLAKQKAVLSNTEEIDRLIKKHPYDQDLRALHAIHVFLNTQQGGQKNRLAVLREALIEIGIALNNEGFCVFNITWFIQIYIAYLETLLGKMRKEYANTKHNTDEHLTKIIGELYQKQIEVQTLLSIKTKLSSLENLQKRLSGTIYIAESIRMGELREACGYMKKGEETAKIGDKKTAGYVLFVTMSIALICARIPVLWGLVKEILQHMPDVSRDIILQKRLVLATKEVTMFELAQAGGKKDRATDIAARLYQNCMNTIDQHLHHTILSKLHEIDPFLKIAWVTKAANGLFNKEQYYKMLTESRRSLEIVMGERGQIKGAHEIGSQMMFEINEIINEYYGGRRQTAYATMPMD